MPQLDFATDRQSLICLPQTSSRHRPDRCMKIQTLLIEHKLSMSEVEYEAQEKAAHPIRWHPPGTARIRGGGSSPGNLSQAWHRGATAYRWIAGRLSDDQPNRDNRAESISEIFIRSCWDAKRAQIIKPGKKRLKKRLVGRPRPTV
jgi:hypothetical protein